MNVCAMNIEEFSAAINAAKDESGAADLAARAWQTGDANLLRYLKRLCSRDSNLIWHGGPMLMSALVFERYKSSDFTACHSERDMTLLHCRDPRMLTEIEKKGWDVRLLTPRQLCQALEYHEVIPWLHERVDLTKEISSTRDDWCPVAVDLKALLVLRKINCHGLAAVLAMSQLEQVGTEKLFAEYMRKGILTRWMFLIDNGEPLYLMLTKGSAKDQKKTRELLMRNGFSQSDFASVGL